ncbi:MAG: homogentisate phytyltransferase [Cyanobacteria bacterium J06597_1]
MLKTLLSMWRFSRPHTIYGTSASILGLYLLAYNSSEMGGLASLSTLAIALVACLCANIYIVGLNQLYDIEIDRINKPHLPLASKALSWQQGCWIVGLTGILSVALSAVTNPYLLATVSISSIIGTAYSLPPIRLKRFPFPASLCIYTVRGLVVNIGLYLYFRSEQSLTPQTSPELWALVGFVLVFTLAIALFKDIPDMEGDRQFNVATISILLGAKQTFHLCLWLLTATYIAVTVAALQLFTLDARILGFGHAIAVALLWWYRSRLSSWSSDRMYGYYQLIWKLFYVEYLLFPVAYLATQ